MPSLPLVIAVILSRGPSRALAYRPFVSTDAAVADRGEDRPGGELVGIASGRALGWTYHLNGGGLVEPGGDEPGILWGVIVERPLLGRVRAVAEVNGETVRGSNADTSALLGAVWDVAAPSPLHELSVEVGGRHGISRPADEWGGTGRFTVALPCVKVKYVGRHERNHSLRF